MIDIRPLISDIQTTIDTHQLDRTGAYARWITPHPVAGKSRELGLNEYGVADAANLHYTIGDFPSAPGERASWIAVLQELQDPQTGLYTEATHHTFHTTAHCIAALELFDAKPKYPLKGMEHLLEKDALIAFLEGMNWGDMPWQQSHQGAGVYASLVIAGEASLEWQNWYFDWLWQNADPQTGLWRRDYISHDTPRGIFPHLAGSFHYLFNQEYAHRPLRYPAQLVDFCLELRRENWWPNLGKMISFADIDWVYCLTRSLRQSGHRFQEVQDTLRSFAADYVAYLNGLDKTTHEGWNDLHDLFGTTCCLAELQQSVPGLLQSEIPLKLVLDRRPFI